MVKAVILISVLVLWSTRTLQGVPALDVQVEGTVAPAEVDSAPIGKAKKFNVTEDCTAAPDAGPCKEHIPRYFYNSTSMRCEIFIYGGCDGNQNNFETEKECLKGCHPEEACTAAPEAGLCLGYFPHYFYNSTSESCEVFIYGGCGGNQNNFKNEKDCRQRCHSEEACTAAPEAGPCKGYFPRYFYNSTSESCEVFIYGGCGGNQNNFKNEKVCQQRCHSEEACTAAPERGPCKGNIPRYFYNSTSKSCEVFIYGGCRGNQNNFKNEKECLERCHIDG